MSGKQQEELARIFKYVSAVAKDTESLEQEITLYKSGVSRLRCTVDELGIIGGQLEEQLSQTRDRLNQLLEYFMKRIESEHPAMSDDEDTAADRTVMETSSSVSVSVKASDSPPANSRGVMIFISPPTDDKGHREGADSTCTPRRQLVPTIQEEKMVLDYLIKNNHKPTQEEYNRVYKEISNMLIQAPKNAVAIEVRSADPRGDRKYVELAYHVQIKDQLDLACLKYIEIKGVDAYRMHTQGEKAG